MSWYKTTKEDLDNYHFELADKIELGVILESTATRYESDISLYRSRIGIGGFSDEVKARWEGMLFQIKFDHLFQKTSHENFKNTLKLFDKKLGDAIKRQEKIRDCIVYPLELKYPDTFKEEKCEDGRTFDSYYVDQSFSVINTSGFHMSSGFTSYGIKELDSFYCNEIMNYDSEFSAKTLEKAIKRQPNLHNVIKTNLLDNLRSYVQQGRR